jgi:hypothetical protein
MGSSRPKWDAQPSIRGARRHRLFRKRQDHRQDELAMVFLNLSFALRAVEAQDLQVIN